MPEIPSDHDIIRAIKGGSAGAFKQVFDKCYESLCQYAFTMVKEMDEAEDIVQAMFLKLWERRDTLDIRHSIRTYLFKSVYHQCINQLEHRKIKQKYLERSQWTVEHAQPDAFPHELEEKLKRIVDGLPPQCRTIFMMSRYEELRYPEIASKLNISVNTIQNQICKALKILRAELKE
jgi:RNA polymerase sigma-70 factor, ECF subfamily